MTRELGKPLIYSFAFVCFQMTDSFYNWIPLLVGSTNSPVPPTPKCRHLLLAAGFCLVTFACIDWMFGCEDFLEQNLDHTSAIKRQLD